MFSVDGIGYAASMDQDHAEQVLGYIGANVRRLRLRRGLSQEALAEAASISTGFLQNLERGKTNVGVVVLVHLADALEVKPGVLFRPTVIPEVKIGRPRKSERK